MIIGIQVKEPLTHHVFLGIENINYLITFNLKMNLQHVTFVGGGGEGGTCESVFFPGENL